MQGTLFSDRRGALCATLDQAPASATLSTTRTGSKGDDAQWVSLIDDAVDHILFN